MEAKTAVLNYHAGGGRVRLSTSQRNSSRLQHRKIFKGLP